LDAASYGVAHSNCARPMFCTLRKSKNITREPAGSAQEVSPAGRTLYVWVAIVLQQAAEPISRRDAIVADAVGHLRHAQPIAQPLMVALEMIKGTMSRLRRFRCCS